MVAHARRITRSTDSSSKVARCYKEGLFTQYLQQITQLILDFLRAVHSLGNLIAQQLAIALPQTMDGDARRAFGDGLWSTRGRGNSREWRAEKCGTCPFHGPPGASDLW